MTGTPLTTMLDGIRLKNKLHVGEISVSYGRILSHHFMVSVTISALS
jgi:hypothetical protein